MENKMQIHMNVTLKNEAIILNEVLKYWKDYDVDRWIFYDDNSTDGSSELIGKVLGDRATILNDRLLFFDETHNRNRMLEYSRNNGADVTICIDADELLSTNFDKNIRFLLVENINYNLQCFWFNVVDNISKMRNDPCYSNNYKSFIAPMKYTDSFNGNMLMHCPRTPNINLPTKQTKEIGFIHLQSINKRFYALKQLWYKHFEFHEYKYPVHYINSRYDPVVNNLNFCEIDTPKEICEGIDIDPCIYDEIEKIKGYQDYVKNHYVRELVTFGEEYL
jgi:hypothetical protein